MKFWSNIKLTIFLGAISVMVNAEEPQPVMTPSLVNAINLLYTDTSKSTQDDLQLEINKAKFLTLILQRKIETEKDSDGINVTSEGAKVSIVGSSDSNGNPYLILFTDWDALHKYAKKIDMKDYSGFVIYPETAWNMVINQKKYHGAVINPAANSLPLNFQQIDNLNRKLKANKSVN